MLTYREFYLNMLSRSLRLEISRNQRFWGARGSENQHNRLAESPVVQEAFQSHIAVKSNDMSLSYTPKPGDDFFTSTASPFQND